MNTFSPDAFKDHRSTVAVRNDLAARRKARGVNLAILARQQGAALFALTRFRLDSSAQAALSRLVAAGVAEDCWTAATSRDLRAAIRGLTVAAGRLDPALAAADRLRWHLDRLRELAAQDAHIAVLEAALEACWPVGLKAVLRQRAASTRKRR